MPKSSKSAMAETFILEMITARRIPGSNHRGVSVSSLQRLFENKFSKSEYSLTLDRMIRSAKVIAVEWEYGNNTYNRRPTDAYIFGSFPDPNLPDKKDPILYLPNDLPRIILAYSSKAPTLQIAEAIEERRKQAHRTLEENRKKRLQRFKVVGSQ